MKDKQVILELATDLASAYVSHNQIPPEDVPYLVKSIYMDMAMALASDIPTAPEKPVPAVPIEESVFDDYLICLEDGQRYKSLKRHLRSQYQMTPHEYREKWGLPADYPMVAKNYSKERSRLAKRTGLGKS